MFERDVGGDSVRLRVKIAQFEVDFKYVYSGVLNEGSYFADVALFNRTEERDAFASHEKWIKHRHRRNGVRRLRRT